MSALGKKQLELAVNRKFQDRQGNDWYVWGDTCVKPFVADSYSDIKRLTDAELAAEVQRAVFHEAECEVRGLRLIISNPGHPGIDHWAAHNHEFGRQATILERFATLPHYDETPGLTAHQEGTQ